MSEIGMRFGAALKELRTAQGYSQEAFAEKCGLHRTYISDVELGKRNISLENIEKVSSALGMSVSEFFEAVEKQ